MNKLFSLICFILVIIGCHRNQLYLEEQQQASFYPFIITHIESTFITATYKIIGYTRSIPPNPIKKIDGYIYQVSFTIQVNDKSDWNKPFFIRILHANGVEEFIEYNSNETILAKNNLFDYTFEIEIKNYQKIILTLGYVNKNGEDVIHPDNPFQSKSIFLE